MQLIGKNNSINFLTNYNTNNGDNYLYDILIKNGIVYTVGENYLPNNGKYAPLYFQNNVPVPLTGFTSTQDASAYSIFVK
ncbi:hypothetical protein [Ferruginibacter sp.]|nr:hypothetical protein [Ferruginibacter sp.]